MAEHLLVAEKIEAGYPGKQILFGVDFTVRKGEVVVLLGANGSGKSTALNTVSGFVRPFGGRLLFNGQNIAGLPSHQIFRLGIAQVSQSRDLFPDMSVEDNLKRGVAAECHRFGLEPKHDLSRLSASWRAAKPGRAHNVGWRAADGRHRPRAHFWPALATSR